MVAVLREADRASMAEMRNVIALPRSFGDIFSTAIQE